jgi:hypothetical protein
VVTVDVWQVLAGFLVMGGIGILAGFLIAALCAAPRR